MTFAYAGRVRETYLISVRWVALRHRWYQRDIHTIDGSPLTRRSIAEWCLTIHSCNIVRKGTCTAKWPRQEMYLFFSWFEHVAVHKGSKYPRTMYKYRIMNERLNNITVLKYTLRKSQVGKHCIVLLLVETTHTFTFLTSTIKLCVSS